MRNDELTIAYAKGMLDAILRDFDKHLEILGKDFVRSELETLARALRNGYDDRYDGKA